MAPSADGQVTDVLDPVPRGSRRGGAACVLEPRTRYRSRGRTLSAQVEQRPAQDTNVALPQRRADGAGERHIRFDPGYKPGSIVSGLNGPKTRGRLGRHGAWRSLVSHSVWGRKIAGSNPAAPIFGSNFVRHAKPKFPGAVM